MTMLASMWHVCYSSRDDEGEIVAYHIVWKDHLSSSIEGLNRVMDFFSTYIHRA